MSGAKSGFFPLNLRTTKCATSVYLEKCIRLRFDVPERVCLSVRMSLAIMSLPELTIPDSSKYAWELTPVHMLIFIRKNLLRFILDNGLRFARTRHVFGAFAPCCRGTYGNRCVERGSKAGKGNMQP